MKIVYWVNNAGQLLTLQPISIRPAHGNDPEYLLVRPLDNDGVSNIGDDFYITHSKTFETAEAAWDEVIKLKRANLAREMENIRLANARVERELEELSTLFLNKDEWLKSNI